MLLIITNKNDFAADFLITELIKHDKPYFRLNSEDIDQYGYDYRITDGRANININLADHAVDLSLIDSIWYRRKITNKISTKNSPSEYYIANERQRLVEGILQIPDVKWVNPISSTERLERKPYQFVIAKKYGFKLPDTLISNNPDEIRTFYNANQKKIICKPIYHGLYIEQSAKYAINTSRITQNDIENACLLSKSPTLFQKEIEKGTDIRVTIVGDDIFPVEIHTESKSLDWRPQQIEKSYTSYKIDARLESNCRRMMKDYGLLFGAFDFVKDPDGEIYFMEINPTGEWAWLEISLSLPICNAFIKLFYGGVQQ